MSKTAAVMIFSVVLSQVNMYSKKVVLVFFFSLQFLQWDIIFQPKTYDKKNKPVTIIQVVFFSAWSNIWSNQNKAWILLFTECIVHSYLTGKCFATHQSSTHFQTKNRIVLQMHKHFNSSSSICPQSYSLLTHHI